MHDVAERAGVSAKTVSRVMRGEPWVAIPTANRVRAAMEELGYHGNEAAGALKRGQTRIFGLLCPLLTMSFWSDVAAGAEAAAHEHGFSLLLCDTSDSLQKEADYLSLLLRHRVAGIIYVHPRCPPETHPACAVMMRLAVPVVVISSDPSDLPYCHVRTDDRRAGYVAVRHLLDLGRQRIVVVGSGAFATSTLLPPAAVLLDRVRGASAAFEEAGIPAEQVPLLLTPGTIEGGRSAGAALLSGDMPPYDGVFATSDIVAVGMLEAFRAQGVRVPDDIAVVGHDDLPASLVSNPSLTTIAPPRVRMGRTCIDLLQRARAGETLPTVHMLEATFKVRESTIGPMSAARDGINVGLSNPEAWSAWRTQESGPAIDQADAQPPTRLTVDALTRWEEVMVAIP